MPNFWLIKLSEKEQPLSSPSSPVESYCEVCGIDVDPNTKLKRFGKLFCSDEHLNQYIEARQKKLGLDGDREELGYRQEPRRRRWGGC